MESKPKSTRAYSKRKGPDKNLKALEKDAALIGKIAKTVVGADISKRTRGRDSKDARFMAYKILRELEYSCMNIGYHFGYDHSSVSHGTSKINDLIDTDREVSRKFTTIRLMFFEQRETPEVVMTADQMKVKIFSLQREADTLTLSNISMQDRLKRYERVGAIINVILEATPVGEEEYILKKVNSMFNGISWKKKDTEANG